MKAIRDLLYKGKGFLARATKGSQQIGQGRRSPRKQEVNWSKSLIFQGRKEYINSREDSITRNGLQ